MLLADVEDIINKHKNIFKHFKILGSYSRNSLEVNDLDLLFDKKDYLKIKSLKDKGLSIKVIWVDDYAITMKGSISDIPFEAYGVEKKYFPSASLLMSGPRDKYHGIKEAAEERGYYMTHFGLLPIEQALSTNLQERFCYESEKKLLFNREDLYENFIYSQSIKKVRRKFDAIKDYIKEEYKYYTYRSVYVEPTTRCNANCVMCFRRGMGHELNFDEFCYILDAVRPLHVKFWGRGESLIADDCYKMIDEMKERGIVIYLTTNFNVERIDWASLSKVDVIYVSIHTFDPVNYKKITGLDINNVLNNIITARNRKMNIVLKSVVSKYNENDIKSFKEICEKYKLKYILTGVNFPDEESKKKMWLQSDVVRRKPGVYKRCIQPHYPNILANGDVYRCCMLPESSYLGNVFNDFDLAADKILAIERKLIECKDCTLC